MTLRWRGGGAEGFADWEEAAVEARRLIIYAGATSVSIHEEE